MSVPKVSQVTPACYRQAECFLFSLQSLSQLHLSNYLPTYLRPMISRIILWSCSGTINDYTKSPEDAASTWSLIFRSNQLHFELFAFWYVTFVSVTSSGITGHHANSPFIFYRPNCFSFHQQPAYCKVYKSESLCCWQLLEHHKNFWFYPLLIFHRHFASIKGLSKFSKNSSRIYCMDYSPNMSCIWFELSFLSSPT